MKKILFTALSLIAFGTMNAQENGKFEVYDFNSFKLHVYYTNDAMGDASYIVESDKGLVTLEQPLFKDNVAEYDAYLNKLGKKVTNRISDYHLGGTGSESITMAEGMPAFVKGPVYGGMMQGFAKMFGDAIVSLPTGKTNEVKFGDTKTFAGVSFAFNHGATTDFPGASILIGNKVYFTHWVPAKAHANALQISSKANVDAELAEAEKSLASGAELFIGGHGGAAKVDAVKFKIEYLKTVKKLLGTSKTSADFVSAIKKAYPNLPGEEGLEKLAEGLYK
ncbi:MAG: hypothetical protein Q4D41_11660 [Prevotellaceae bacterium]|nr:hypothetical protein [Prevotellaceae bacterium]